MGFRDAYALRPGFIQPMRGVTSRMRSVRWLYALTTPIYPGLQKMFGRWVTSTDRLALAMLQLANVGCERKTLNTGDLNALAVQAAAPDAFKSAFLFFLWIRSSNPCQIG